MGKPLAPPYTSVNMKILIVEDNEPMRRAIRSFIADLADEVHERRTSAEALAAYALHQPDWVLLDWHIGKRGGLEAARQITAVWREAKIVIVAGDDDPDWREAARRAGVCEYIVVENLIEVRRILTDHRHTAQ